MQLRVRRARRASILWTKKQDEHRVLGALMSYSGEKNGSWNRFLLIVKRYVRAAKLPEDISPRALRHTRAAQLQTLGAGAEQVGETLGLTSEQNARAYVRNIAKARAARTRGISQRDSGEREEGVSE